MLLPLSDTARRLLTWGLALSTFSWVLALVGAPYLATHAGAQSGGIFASALPYVAGSLVCHQQAERTLFLWGMQLPVCARCFGLYAGAALGAGVAIGANSVRASRRPRGGAAGSFRTWRLMLAAASVPTAVTAILEWAFRADVGNAARAWAGVPLGAAVTWVVAAALAGGREVAGRAPEVNCADAHHHRRADREE